MQIDVATGRIDAGFTDVSALQNFLGKPEGPDFQLVDVNIISTVDPTLGEGIGVGIRQEDAEAEPPGGLRQARRRTGLFRLHGAKHNAR